MDDILRQRILYHRQRLGMSCAALAAKIGAKRARVQAWEAGRNEPPIDMVRRMSAVFAVPIDTLLTPVPSDDNNSTCVIDVSDLTDEQRRTIFAAVAGFRQTCLF